MTGPSCAMGLLDDLRDDINLSFAYLRSRASQLEVATKNTRTRLGRTYLKLWTQFNVNHPHDHRKELKHRLIRAASEQSVKRSPVNFHSSGHSLFIGLPRIESSEWAALNPDRKSGLASLSKEDGPEHRMSHRSSDIEGVRSSSLKELNGSDNTLLQRNKDERSSGKSWSLSIRVDDGYYQEPLDSSSQSPTIAGSYVVAGSGLSRKPSLKDGNAVQIHSALQHDHHSFARHADAITEDAIICVGEDGKVSEIPLSESRIKHKRKKKQKKGEMDSDWSGLFVISEVAASATRGSDDKAERRGPMFQTVCKQALKERVAALKHKLEHTTLFKAVPMPHGVIAQKSNVRVQEWSIQNNN